MNIKPKNATLKKRKSTTKFDTNTDKLMTKKNIQTSWRISAL